jgi:hypothetical protein
LQKWQQNGSNHKGSSSSSAERAVEEFQRVAGEEIAEGIVVAETMGMAKLKKNVKEGKELRLKKIEVCEELEKRRYRS